MPEGIGPIDAPDFFEVGEGAELHGVQGPVDIEVDEHFQALLRAVKADHAEANKEEWNKRFKTFKSLYQSILRGKGHYRLYQHVAKQGNDIGQLLVQWAEMEANLSKEQLGERSLGLIRPLIHASAFRAAAGAEAAGDLMIELGDISEAGRWREEFSNKLLVSAHLLNLASVMGVGTTLLTRGLMLRRNRQLLKKLKSTLERRPDLKTPLTTLIKALEPAIKKEEEALSGDAKGFAFSASIASAGLLRASVDMLRFFSAPVATGVSAVGGAVLIIASAIGIQEMQKEKNEQEAFAASLHKFKHIKKRHERIQEAIARRRGATKPSFAQEVTIQRAALDEVTRNKALKKSLKTAVQQKHQSMLGRHRVEIAGEKIRLFLGTVAVTVGLTLKVLALTGVFLAPTLLFLLPGLAFLGTAAALAVGGLFFYYRSHPSLFKALLKGYNIKKLWFQLNLSFEEIRVKKARIRQQEVNRKILAVSAYQQELKGLQDTAPSSTYAEQLSKANKALDDDIIILQEKRDRIANQIKKLTAVRDLQKKRLEELQGEIENLAWKDFMARIAKTRKPTQEDLKAKGEPDLMKTLLDGLTEDPTTIDETTKNILLNQMNIDLDALVEKAKKAKEGLRETLEKRLKSFFALNRAGMLAIAKVKQ